MSAMGSPYRLVPGPRAGSAKTARRWPAWASLALAMLLVGAATWRVGTRLRGDSGPIRTLRRRDFPHEPCRVCRQDLFVDGNVLWSVCYYDRLRLEHQPRLYRVDLAGGAVDAYTDFPTEHRLSAVARHAR